jgi:uncharacterized protein (DUF169 family)
VRAETMTKWQDLGKELKRYTNADTFPVSVTFLKDRKEIPEGTRSPRKDMKVKMAPRKKFSAR